MTTDRDLLRAAIDVLADGSSAEFSRLVGMHETNVSQRLRWKSGISETERRYLLLIVAHPREFRRWLARTG